MYRRKTKKEKTVEIIEVNHANKLNLATTIA
jgi:hypothetical protein